MKIQVKLCQCKCCRSGLNTERKILRKKWMKSFRKRSKQFLRGNGRDPLDYLSVPRYTD